MRTFTIFAFIAVFTVFNLSGTSETMAAGDPAVCLKACIDQNGADQKKSCALQCGYGSGAAAGGQQNRDCGTIYKRCLAACKKSDKDCRKSCRQQRTSCY